MIQETTSLTGPMASKLAHSRPWKPEELPPASPFKRHCHLHLAGESSRVELTTSVPLDRDSVLLWPETPCRPPAAFLILLRHSAGDLCCALSAPRHVTLRPSGVWSMTMLHHGRGSWASVSEGCNSLAICSTTGFPTGSALLHGFVVEHLSGGQACREI
jgi:hypothetical protein